jgi:hypothetical protein
MEKMSNPQIRFLSLWQPWASLIPRFKFFETRSWRTNYRGWLVICASKNKSGKENYQLLRSQFPGLVVLPLFNDLPFGVCTALVKLVDCKRMVEKKEDSYSISIAKQSNLELAVGNGEEGRYAWQMEKGINLPPIPIVGMQNIFVGTQEVTDQVFDYARSQGVDF